MCGSKTAKFVIVYPSKFSAILYYTCNISSLQTKMKEQESGMIRSLKDTIGTGKFTCGGTLQGLPKVQLNYIQANGQWAGVTFPDVKDPEFQSLIQSSTITCKL